MRKRIQVWKRLKQLFNRRHCIATAEIITMFRRTNTSRLGDYLTLLLMCGFVECKYMATKNRPNPQYHYRALRKIPTGLTIKEAEQIKDMPWLLWFKYPECERNET